MKNWLKCHSGAGVTPVSLWCWGHSGVTPVRVSLAVVNVVNVVKLLCCYAVLNAIVLLCCGMSDIYAAQIFVLLTKG